MLASKTLGCYASAAADPSWNVANAEFLGTPVNTFNISAQSVQPIGVFFKPDGTKFYMVAGSALVYEYNLATAWDISTLSFLQSKSLSAQESAIRSVFFKPDGLKMYVMGSSGDDVNEYNLSTAWDISTATYVQVFSVAAQDTLPTGLFFKPDGTKMYVLGDTNDRVSEYDLSTAWNISTASYLQNYSVGSGGWISIFFRSDGLKMYTINLARSLREYTLSTAWNVTTATQIQSITAQSSQSTGIFFKPDGSVMYTTGYNAGIVFQYQLSTDWNISTAIFSMPVTKYFSVAAQETTPTDVFFKPDGLKMYVLGDTGNDVNEYDLSSAWAISTATYLQNFSVATQESTPLGLFFKTDGTKMYVVGNATDSVYEYNLSVAWDISTASYLQSFSVAASDSNPVSLFFKPDGLKMYVLGDFDNEINEYNLSTAWDISTSSYLQTFAVGSQETAPQGLFFKPDGTKMYVCGTSGDDVNEYNLSTPWNITSASFVRLFSFVQQTLDPAGIFFRDNGLQMYIISAVSDAVWEYDLV
jgi:DNA-binding beta-propeller fold protein YncE